MQKKGILVILAFAFLLFSSFSALAQYETLSIEDLMDMIRPTSNERDCYAQFPADWDFALIDTRDNDAYSKGHINGAVNVSVAEIAPSLLPGDTSTPLVFYGDMTMEAAIMAQAFGFSNIAVLESSIESWVAAGNYLTTTPVYVNSLLQSDHADNVETIPYLIIDTRDFGMYIRKYVPAAVNMTHTIFENKYIDFMSKNTDMLYITYCGGFF